MTQPLETSLEPPLPQPTESSTHVSVAGITFAENSPLGRPEIGRDSRRSRVTNHRDLLPGLDGRSASARRFRDLLAAYVADMGGLDQCSEIKLGLLRRLAATTVQAEQIESRMVSGEAVDIGTLCQLASTALRLSSRLSIERVPKPVNDVLDPLAYARAREQEAAL
jgi:hypothetical protein